MATYEFTPTVGERIVFALRRKGMTQAELAALVATLILAAVFA